MATNSEKGRMNRYSMFQNADGEIMIMIESRQTGPENPWLFYDGGDMALLCRSPDSAVGIKGIVEDARKVVKTATEVLIVEVNNEDVEREYVAPVRIVRSIEGLYKEV